MKYIFLVAIILSCFVPNALAVQLDAVILSGDDSTEPSFQFLRVIYLEYPDGGYISELLRDEKQTISFVADHDILGIDNLILQLNQNLEIIDSNTTISDVTINYQAILQGNENYAVIEYKIEMIPTITNHVITKTFDTSTVDASWRGLSLDKPVIIDTIHGAFDINNPKSALDVMIPNISNDLKDISILELPLIDASRVLDFPLHRWHSLFDNTAIIASADDVGYVGKHVITYYSMGECNIEIGFCNDREWIEEIELDKKYSIRIVESRDDATILLEGYVDTTQMNGNEVFQTSLNSRVTQKPDTGEFPVTIMYGMAGMAVIGGVVMFVFSNRKLKNDKNQGQTGIDPANLIAYETRNSSGGYKTNRGESYLVSQEKSKTPL